MTDPRFVRVCLLYQREHAGQRLWFGECGNLRVYLWPRPGGEAYDLKIRYEDWVKYGDALPAQLAKEGEQ